MAGTKTCRQFPRAGRNSQGQGSQPILDTNRQNYQAPPLDPMGHCANPFGNAPSTMREDQRNCDATRISQWAANSVPMQGHAVSHWTSQGHYSTNPGNDISINSSVSPAPGSLASQFSSCVQQDPSCVGQMYQTPGHNGNPEMNTTSIGSNFTRIENNLNTFQGHGFDMVGQLPGEQYSDDFSVNNFSCPQSAVNGFSYTTPMDLHPPMVLGESNMAYPLPPEWSSQQMYGQPEENATATSFPLEYSPPLGLTPSVSSSNSLGSFPGPQPDTPVSMDILDQDWLSSQNVPHMGETTFYPQFSLGESRQIPAAANLMDEQRFVVHVDGTYIPPPDSNFSTVRPIGRSQRAPLPLGMMESQQLWSEQEDVAGQANEILSHPVSNGSRRSSEGGTAKEARSDPRYMATPSQDGLYHCPFESKEGCLHKPQKLKCNYE